VGRVAAFAGMEGSRTDGDVAAVDADFLHRYASSERELADLSNRILESATRAAVCSVMGADGQSSRLQEDVAGTGPRDTGAAATLAHPVSEQRRTRPQPHPHPLRQPPRDNGDGDTAADRDVARANARCFAWGSASFVVNDQQENVGSL
jgi:hypothetical protein